MKSKALGLTGLLLIVIVSVFYYQSQPGIALQIEPGDTHEYMLYMDTMFVEDDKILPNTSMSVQMVLITEVVSKTNDEYVLNTRVKRFSLSNNDRLMVDSINSDDFSQLQLNLKAILSQGINQHYDTNGKLLKTKLADTEKLSKMSNELVDNLVYTLDQYAPQLKLFPESYPEASLKEGLSWEVKPSSLKNNLTPSILRYFVTNVADDSFTVLSKMEGPVSVDGYTIVDIASGWPVRSVIQTIQPMPDIRPGLNQKTMIRLRKVSAAPFESDKPYQSRLSMAIRGLFFDLNNPLDRKYFYPPYGAVAPQEFVEKINDSFVWRPKDNKHTGPELDYSPRLLLENSVYPRLILSATLLDENNKAMDFQPGLNPAFDINNYDVESDSFATRTPLLAEPLTDQQRDTLQSIELKVKSDVLADVVEGDLTNNNTPIRLGDDYTVTVENWSPTRVTLRLSHTNGFDTTDWSLLSAEPSTTSGEPIKKFNIKSSHELLEHFFKDKAFGELEDTDAYYEKVINKLRLTAPSQRRGDKIFHIESSTPIGKLKLYLAPFKTTTQTWTAKKQSTSKSASGISGTRTIPESQIPNVIFEQLSMDDMSVTGVEQHQIKINVPGRMSHRCELSLNDVKTYREHKLAFEKRDSHSDFQLVSDNGTYFFYDLAVSFNIQCVTGIAQKKIDVDSSDLVKRIDKHTVELTDKGRKVQNDVIQHTILPTNPIGRNIQGAALQSVDITDNDNGSRYRFWGEVKTLTIPMVTERSTRRYNVSFAPLP